VTIPVFVGIILPIFVIILVLMTILERAKPLHLRDINGDVYMDILFSQSDGFISAGLGVIGHTNLLYKVSIIYVIILLCFVSFALF
jgi:hypothetical protein